MMKKIAVSALFVCAALLSGSMLSSAAVAADAVKTCGGCHGTDGTSSHANVPVIGGMSSAYIADTMNKYKSGDRKNCEEVKIGSVSGDMCKVAKDMSDDDIKAVSDHFAAKKFVRAKQGTNAALVKKGKEIAETACEKCHTEGGSVAGDDAGILSGQWKSYLKKEINDFREGKRSGTKKMVSKMEKLEPAEIDALAEYFAAGR